MNPPRPRRRALTRSAFVALALLAGGTAAEEASTAAADGTEPANPGITPLALAVERGDAAGLELLAGAGDAQAAYLLARTIARSAEDSAALELAGAWLVAAADAGHAGAAERLGLDPHLIPSTETRSGDDFVRLAADRGLPSAQWRLGEAHALGEGLERDYTAARFWLGLAADGGNTRAQFTLAWLHENGYGGPVDAREAQRRYRQAAAGGDVRALNNLAWLMTQEEGDLEEALQLAMRSFERRPAADTADTLGWIQYHRGETEAARYWLERSLEIHPEQTGPLQRLAEVCLAVEDEACARDAFNDALEASNDPAERRAITRRLAELAPVERRMRGGPAVSA